MHTAGRVKETGNTVQCSWPGVLVLRLIGFIASPAFLTTDNLIGVAQQSTGLSLLCSPRPSS